jgi:hypothetical protein
MRTGASPCLWKICQIYSSLASGATGDAKNAKKVDLSGLCSVDIICVMGSERGRQREGARGSEQTETRTLAGA